MPDIYKKIIESQDKKRKEKLYFFYSPFGVLLLWTALVIIQQIGWFLPEYVKSVFQFMHYVVFSSILMPLSIGFECYTIAKSKINKSQSNKLSDKLAAFFKYYDKRDNIIFAFFLFFLLLCTIPDVVELMRNSITSRDYVEVHEVKNVGTYFTSGARTGRSIYIDDGRKLRLTYYGMEIMPGKKYKMFIIGKRIISYKAV